MRVRTESGTVYAIAEERDTIGPLFVITRTVETEPNPNGIRLGYRVTARALTVRVGERLEVPGVGPRDGLRTTPVVEILPDTACEACEPRD